MRNLIVGLSALVLFTGPAPKPSEAATAARIASSSAQQAIVECRARYGGDRGRAGNQRRPIWIEDCFKEKTGRYPFELGIPIYPPGYDPRLEYGFNPP
jgi:hypothetical protein